MRTNAGAFLKKHLAIIVSAIDFEVISGYGADDDVSMRSK